MNFSDLEEIKREENLIRDNLYRDEYKLHEMNKNPYYNLIEITEESWNWICESILKIRDDKSLYFSESRLYLRKRISRSWKDIEKKAKRNRIEEYFGENADYVFVAGGKALSTLLTIPHSDCDYFTTKEIKPWEIKSESFEISPNVITFGKNQLIKRLYKTPHEIVHSFDIDCCAVLINKEGKIFGSKRFLYALVNGYNTVDFNYLSPSYEWRLIKYSNRGFSVHIPYIINCNNAEMLLQETENGICIPDSIWAYGDIDDILQGSMLKAMLTNAQGIQKILIASAVSNSEYFENNNQTHLVTTLVNTQLSDYEKEIKADNPVKGIIDIGTKLFLHGYIGSDNYVGALLIVGEDNSTLRNAKLFSKAMQERLLSILDSPYKKVNPGEQTTSTFHKIVLENPNEWFKIDNENLFLQTLYTILYYKRLHSPPVLYDEKVMWFGSNIVNSYVYHFARLFLNNRMYNKFNEMEITKIKIAYGDIRPKSIIYQSEEYQLDNQDSKGIFETILIINDIHDILSPDEKDLLLSLSIRTEPNIIPLIEDKEEE